MKLNAALLILSATALTTACSSGGGGNGSGGPSKSISPAMNAEYSKPQVYNAEAVEWLKAQAKKSNNTLPGTDLVLNGDKTSDAYTKLDPKGKDWFDVITKKCTITNPPKKEGSSEGSETRTEKIDGANCPIRYVSTQKSEMNQSKTDRTFNMNGRISQTMSQEILDADLQRDSDLESTAMSMDMTVQGDGSHDGKELLALAIKIAGSGTFSAKLASGDVTGDFRIEMVQLAAKNQDPTVKMIAVGTVRTPEGDLSIGMRAENQTIEFRIGGKVMTAEQMKDTFGDLPTNPAALIGAAN